MNKDGARDSEEDDSDYTPEDEEEEDEDQSKVQWPQERIGTGIRAHKRSAVDALWAEMNAEDATAVAAGAASTSKAKGKKSKKRKAEKKANKVLAGIFGKKAASSIVSGASMKKDVKKRKSSGGAGKSEEVTRAQALAASRTVEVSEVKKYAGKEILVKRKVTAGSAEHSAVAAVQKKRGIDSVLAALDGPKSISTVTKSSMDWDTYKAAEGIEGDMDQATKDGKGFLNKQDFLQRCDVRKFESELEARNAKRDA
ncbi:unnamed protein product [Sphacelaria rigidula]